MMPDKIHTNKREGTARTGRPPFYFRPHAEAVENTAPG